MLRLGARSHMIAVRCVHEAYHRLSPIDSMWPSCVAMTPVVHRHIFATHRVPLPQVPVVVQRGGKPVHHGTVERAYEKLRAIIQMFVLHKQEDRRLVWPPVVSFSSIEQHMHYIHTTTCYVGKFHRTAHTAYTCDASRSPSNVHVPLRRSSLAMPRR